MAISYANISVHSRSKGHSAVAAAAYRAGIKLYDERLGLTYDFSHRHDVQYSELLLPEGTEQSFTEREFIWNEVERAETRKNAQVCKDIMLALPKELDLVQQIELAKRFAQVHFVDKGIPADISIHDHGDGNPHAHILITTRRLEKNQFAKHKARDLNPQFAKGFITEKEQWHQQWREFQDSYFAEKGIDLTVDLNHIIPERHHGGFRDKASHYLLEENELIKQAREEIVLNDIENFINILSIEHSVFTRKDIETLLFKTITQENYNEFFQVTVERVLSDKNVICLGENEQGQKAFTTRHQYLQESKLLNAVERLQERTGHVYQTDTGQFLQATTLSEEQQQAFEFIVNGGDISCIIGRPGVGKSYMLTPVKDFYQQQGCRVLGATLSGKVAKQLQIESGIESSTIASLTAQLMSGKLSLNANDILIIDEAGMVDFANMSYLIERVKEAKAKLILVGDPDQLKPIKKGAIFKGIASQVGCFTMVDIKRQRHAGDRQASIELAKGNIETGLTHYLEQNAIVIADNERSNNASELLINAWQANINQHEDLRNSIIIAHANVTVDSLNLNARELLMQKGILATEQVNIIKEIKSKNRRYQPGQYIMVTHSDNELGLIGGEQGRISAVDDEQNITLNMNDGREIIVSSHLRRYVEQTGLQDFYLAKGERIFFKKGDKDIGVKNGDLATITQVNEEGFTAVLDSGATVNVPKRYMQIDYAYAMTVHKSQGMSVENTYVCIDTQWWDRALSFVAFTRHKEKLKIFANSKNYPSFKVMVEQLSRKTLQDNVIDYPMNLGIRHGFKFDNLVERAVKRISSASQIIRDKANYLYNYAQVVKSQKLSGHIENRNAIREVARNIAQYIDLRNRIANQYQQLQTKSEKLGIEMSSLKKYDDFYKLACARDKKASDIKQQLMPGQLATTNFKQIDDSQIQKEACRHETLKTIRAIIRSPSNLISDHELCKRAQTVTLTNDRLFISQELKKAHMSEYTFKERLHTLQQNQRQTVYKELKKEYPLLQQYDELVAIRRKLTGFQGKESDKIIQNIAGQIVSNEPLVHKLKRDLPNLLINIRNRMQLDKTHSFLL
ncbi:Conjugal transfer protein TraA [Legionella quinlivanii]|uniref:Conjugal transfer protein TraA n=2 Tax=Legionella quinlivanii TaxID=45073 RepID=A0A0W0XTI3_9GAMM|nr:Ti-type conjugative transfer relaxase TraA [Legionella quinlivanii]KTD47882.1 Conjugal transfer protein TraA [Legionella quinlivanii]SEG37406.1 Ti-type conjugative transfer relaxase TraA [Legionella quinlivanii DSM 21216]STY10124.1 Conjugal transfer protein TraA [Legionella quinlivanii]